MAPSAACCTSLRLLLLAALLSVVADAQQQDRGPSHKGWYKPIPGTPQYLSYFDDPPMIAMEAENFTLQSLPKVHNEFVSGDWGHAPTRYAATIANTFMSRRSCLHAPANVSNTSVATMLFSVAKAATYNVLLRYESAYLFETPFLVEILTGTAATSTVVYSKIYGERHSLKVQGFGKARLKKAPGAGPTGPYTQGSMCGSGRVPTVRHEPSRGLCMMSLKQS